MLCSDLIARIAQHACFNAGPTMFRRLYKSCRFNRAYSSAIAQLQIPQCVWVNVKKQCFARIVDIRRFEHTWIYWGDGSAPHIVSAHHRTLEHVYPSARVYCIRLYVRLKPRTEPSFVDYERWSDYCARLVRWKVAMLALCYPVVYVPECVSTINVVVH